MVLTKAAQRDKKGGPPIPDWAANHPAWVRLEDQLDWYDSTSNRCQKWYKGMKFVQIALAVLIPVMGLLEPPFTQWAASIAGALIAILEGMQHLNQYSTLWVTYRATAEYLKHEKFLFLSGAGPYRGFSNDDRLVKLSEQVEERVSAEHANWFNDTRRLSSGTKKEGG